EYWLSFQFQIEFKLHDEHTEDFINKFKFCKDDNDIINLLDRLPHGYDNIFNYMKITTILKSHNKFNIFEKLEQEKQRQI
ncbi:MAG: hypothetical protein ACKPKO_46475, partial [Candidatus Fonsibacter sp.]